LYPGILSEIMALPLDLFVSGAPDIILVVADSFDLLFNASLFDVAAAAGTGALGIGDAAIFCLGKSEIVLVLVLEG